MPYCAVDQLELHRKRRPYFGAAIHFRKTPRNSDVKVFAKRGPSHGGEDAICSLRLARIAAVSLDRPSQMSTQAQLG
jgi:hypothetical protein